MAPMNKAMAMKETADHSQPGIRLKVACMSPTAANTGS